MRITTRLAPVAALVVLAGCGGTAAASPNSAAELAQLIGCHGYHVNRNADALLIGKSMGLVSDGSCTLREGGTVQVQWYRSSDAIDTAMQFAHELGGTGYCLQGGNWLVCGSKKDVQAAHAEAGGDVRWIA